MLLMEEVVEQTPLIEAHLDSVAKSVDYSGYRLPLYYKSVLAEHQAVRKHAAMFDLSYVHVLEVSGASATFWLRMMLTNDVAKLGDSEGMQTCLCNENGGVIDTFFVFRIDAEHYRLHIDAARCDRCLKWMRSKSVTGVSIKRLLETTVIGVQGPDAVSACQQALDSLGMTLPLEPLHAFAVIEEDDWFVSRTSFTGEDGVELVVPDNQALTFWQALAEQTVVPAGLAALNTLRLEAGFGLYGLDIDERHSPAECGLEHTVDLSDEDRQFLGKPTVEDHKLFGGNCYQIGLITEGKGSLQRGAVVELAGEPIGEVTSTAFSPTRQAACALARVSRKFDGCCDVNMNGKLRLVRSTSLPFVPHGLARE